MVTEAGPSASDIVYLFGDRFAKKARLGGEQLVYGGNKVNHKGLSEQMLLAAFADLASQGYLGMERVEEKKLGLFKSKDVVLTRLGSPQESLHGLEAAIWDKLTGDPKADRVWSITARIIGQECLNPWKNLVDITKTALLEQGYLNADKEELHFRPDKTHWSANEALISPHQGRVDEIKAQLSALEARDPALYKVLLESVQGGIRSMVEQTDSDIDFD